MSESEDLEDLNNEINKGDKLIKIQYPENREYISFSSSDGTVNHNWPD